MNGTLAPPFTRETAGDNARKATISREKNRLNRNLASNPSHAMVRAAKQVEKVLSWMDKEKDRDKFSQLTAMLDRLWNKAFPTQGAVKSPRSRDRQSAPSVIETPAEMPVQNPPSNQ